LDGDGVEAFEEGIGAVRVDVVVRDDEPPWARLWAAQTPEFGPAPPPPSALADVVSLTVADLEHPDVSPGVISCGLPYVVLPVRDRDALARAQLNLAAWEAVLSEFWAPAVYLYTIEHGNADAPIYARMFGPGHDVLEDPATGSAAAALGGYLGTQAADVAGTHEWLVHQGIEIGRPSRIEVGADVRDGRVDAVRVGGHAVLMTRGSLLADEIR